METLNSKLYMQTLALKNKKTKAEDTLQGMVDNRKKFFDEDEQFEALGEYLMTYTDDQINNMTLEEVLGVGEKMVEYGFNIECPRGSRHKPDEFLKDMILYLKSMYESEVKMTELVDAYDTEIGDIESQLTDIMEDYSHSVTKLMRQEIENNPNFKSTKMGALYESIMAAFDSTFELKAVKEVAQQVDPANTINDYKINKEKVYKQYLTTLKRLGVKHDLMNFKDIQSKVTDKTYEGYEDFLIFILMKFIAKRAQSVDFSKPIDGVFASQLCTNFYLLSTDDGDENIQTVFKNSCKELLELYLG